MNLIPRTEKTELWKTNETTHNYSARLRIPSISSPLYLGLNARIILQVLSVP